MAQILPELEKNLHEHCSHAHMFFHIWVQVQFLLCTWQVFIIRFQLCLFRSALTVSAIRNKQQEEREDRQTWLTVQKYGAIFFHLNYHCFVISSFIQILKVYSWRYDKYASHFALGALLAKKSDMFIVISNKHFGQFFLCFWTFKHWNWKQHLPFYNPARMFWFFFSPFPDCKEYIFLKILHFIMIFYCKPFKRAWPISFYNQGKMQKWLMKKFKIYSVFDKMSSNQINHTVFINSFCIKLHDWRKSLSSQGKRLHLCVIVCKF